MPSVFLRLATCNLACRWCDTKYTWDWTNFSYETEVVELEPTTIQQKIQAYDCSHVVITGGEPMLQQEGLQPLVESLAAEGYTFEVETNGTIAPTPGMLRHIEQWNVSPKLRTSGNLLSETLNPFPADVCCIARRLFQVCDRSGVGR